MKPDGCKLCPWFEGSRIVLPEVPRDVRLLVQGEAPGEDETKTGHPFTGPSGFWLRRNILGNAGVSDETVLFDNTLRCLVGKSGNYPTGKKRKLAEKICRQYDIWHQFPGRPLLLLGAKAIATRMPDDKVGKWGGSIAVINGTLTGCTYHPAAVLRKPNLLPAVIAHVRNLVKAERNPDRLRHPQVNKQWIAWPSQPFTFDLEWDKDGKITILGISYKKGEANSKWCSESDLRELRQRITDGPAVVSGHNIIKADLVRLGFTAEQIRDLAEKGRIADTIIKAHIVHPYFAELGLYGLSDLVKICRPTTEWKFDKADQLEYNGRDAAYNWELNQYLDRQLESTSQTHLLPVRQQLAAMTVAMSQNGIAIDRQALQSYALELEEKRRTLAAGFSFNPRSPKQIKKWAKEECGITLRNTEYETLKDYEGRHPELDKLIQYKEDSKQLSTWFPVVFDKDGNPEVVDDMIWPDFKVTGTAVSRFSCGSDSKKKYTGTDKKQPNVQNLPAGGERLLPGGIIKHMPDLRRFLIARSPDTELLSFDYSQLEDWTVACVSGDQQLLADLQSGLDIHRQTAATFMSMVLGHPVDPGSFEKKGPERFKGKQTNHQAKYLISGRFLSEQIFGSVSRDCVSQAEMLLRAYFHRYKGVALHHLRLAQQFERGDLSVRNAFGGLRVIFAQERMVKGKSPRPDPVYPPLVVKHHEKVKMGMHFQGCSPGAEILNRRVLMVWKELNIAPWAIIHDEGIWEVERGSKADRIARDIQEIMYLPVEELGGIRIPTGFSRGDSYGRLKEEKLLAA